MSGTIDKANFLRNKLIPLLRTIPEGRQPNWGKMNVHQMIEHMSYSLRQANGKEKYELAIDEQFVPKAQAFLLSDKPFRENTPNQLLPETPVEPSNETIEQSLEELQKEIEDFFDTFAETPSLKLMNPFFGELSYEQWVQLLQKHAWHHLRQFGVSAE